MKLKKKPARFLWRASKNVLCVAPFTRQMLFSQDKLSLSFGRGDADYAWQVFQHHYYMLKNSGFSVCTKILEVGPGRNLGSSLLWWAYCALNTSSEVKVVCWDVFRNASPEANDYWENLAGELLGKQPDLSEEVDLGPILGVLKQVASGRLQPKIDYYVGPLEALEAEIGRQTEKFDLVYSHAAIEHIWNIDVFWETIVKLTGSNGWHSHRIDLADHGGRDSNYIEMLEWSKLGYWLTMRFIPGATNRWRAGHHLHKLADLGVVVKDVYRETREQLPIPLSKLDSEFKGLTEDELRTTAIDFIGVKL